MDYEGVKKYIIERMSKGLPANLYYHGIHHTLDVLEAAERYAMLENISEQDKLYLFTAALFHDAGYLIRYRMNEDASAAICRQVLPHYGFSSDDIAYINALILSTSIPQKPFDRLSRILCDADLDYLGRRDFFIRGCNLRREFKEYGREFNVAEWYEHQIGFLSAHFYHTRTAFLLREGKKQEHLRFIKMLVKKM